MLRGNIPPEGLPMPELINRRDFHIVRFKNEQGVYFEVDLLSRTIYREVDDKKQDLGISGPAIWRTIDIFLSGFQFNRLGVVEERPGVIPRISLMQLQKNHEEPLSFDQDRVPFFNSTMRNIFELNTKSKALLKILKSDNKYWTFDPQYHDVEYENEKAEEWRKYELGKLNDVSSLKKSNIFHTIEKEDSPADDSFVIPEIERTLQINEPKDLLSDSPEPLQILENSQSYLTDEPVYQDVAVEESEAKNRQKHTVDMKPREAQTFKHKTLVLTILTIVLCCIATFFTIKTLKGRPPSKPIDYNVNNEERKVEKDDIQYLLSVDSETIFPSSRAIENKNGIQGSLNVNISNNSSTPAILTKVIFKVKELAIDTRPYLSVTLCENSIYIKNTGWCEILYCNMQLCFDHGDFEFPNICTKHMGSFGFKATLENLDAFLSTCNENMDSIKLFQIENNIDDGVIYEIDGKAVDRSAYIRTKINENYFKNRPLSKMATLEYTVDGQTKKQFSEEIPIILEANAVADKLNFKTSNDPSQTYEIIQIKKKGQVSMPFYSVIEPKNQNRPTFLVDTIKSADLSGDLILFTNGEKIVFQDIKLYVKIPKTN